MKTLSGKEFVNILEKKGWILKRTQKGLQQKLMMIAGINDNEL